MLLMVRRRRRRCVQAHEFVKTVRDEYTYTYIHHMDMHVADTPKNSVRRS